MNLRICTACGNAITLDEDEEIRRHGGAVIARFCQECNFLSENAEDFLYVDHTYAFYWEEMFV